MASSTRASARPVYLYINDDVAELRDASHLWGKSVWETEESLKKSHQDPLLRISTIGLAGENKVLCAAVVNDLHRAAGRSGVGAVMAGWWVGVLVYLLPKRGTLRVAGEDTAGVVVAAISAIALAIAALWLQHCCKSPEEPPENGDAAPE